MTNKEERTKLVGELAEELLNKKKEVNSAIVCLIISKQVEEVINLWKKRAIYMMKRGFERSEALYLLFEKCVLLKTICHNKKPMIDFDLILSDMAEIMNGEGLKMQGIKYLCLGNNK